MLKEIRLLWSSSSTFVSSQRLSSSQKCFKLKKTAQIFLKQMVNILSNQMDERSQSKSVEEIVLQVQLTRHLQFLCTKLHNTDAGEQIYLS